MVAIKYDLEKPRLHAKSHIIDNIASVREEFLCPKWIGHELKANGDGFLSFYFLMQLTIRSTILLQHMDSFHFKVDGYRNS